MKKIATLIAFTLSTSIWSVCPDGKTYPVTLTFDDGPHNALTPKVLDILKEEKVPATFFVLGEHFEGGKSNPANKKAYDLLDRMKAEGHHIGSHTYKHIAHTTLASNPEAMKNNINKPNALLKDYLSPILRLPYGDGSFRSKDPVVQKRNDLVMKTVKDSGFTHVGWTIDTNDWDLKKRAKLLKTMLDDICTFKGGIILFHDVQANTVANLKTWIEAIKDQGHPLVGLEKFVPQASDKISPEHCGESNEIKKIKDLNKTIEHALKKIKD